VLERARGSRYASYMEFTGENWRQGAECAEPGVDKEQFFSRDRQVAEMAKKVCQSCLVTEHCLKYAIDHNETSGVWGGTSETERRALRRQVQYRALRRS